MCHQQKKYISFTRGKFETCSNKTENSFPRTGRLFKRSGRLLQLNFFAGIRVLAEIVPFGSNWWQ
jgi:hypothetical protein